MIDLDEIRSLQDYTGMLCAGAVLAWADQTNRNPENISPENIETYLSWVDQKQITFSVHSKRDFKKILGCIQDPECNNSEAQSLFSQVQESEIYGQ